MESITSQNGGGEIQRMAPFQHRWVDYELSKLTSLGYRIEMIGSIADSNKMPLNSKYGPKYMEVIGIKWLIGDFKKRDAAYQSFKQLTDIVRVFYSYDKGQTLSDSVECFKVKYGKG